MLRPSRIAAQNATRLLFGINRPNSDSSETSDPSDDDQNLSGEEDEILSDISTEDNEVDLPVFVGQNTQDMISRDTNEIWKRLPYSTERQHRRQDILRESSGPTRQAIQNGCGDSPLQSFKCFLSTDIVQFIVQHTNEEGRRKENNWKETTVDELYKFFGLLLLAGVYRAKNESVEQLWNKIHGRPVFNRTMPRDR